MATICLYQDTRHEEPLFWMREVLGIGYISRRHDGISELRINGFERVKHILTELKPFIRFKKKQTNALIRICSMLEKKQLNAFSAKELARLIELIFVIKNENYKSRSTLTKDALYERLGLTP